MTQIKRYQGSASDGTPIVAVYAEQPAARVAVALAFVGDGLPRLVHWGRPLADPETVLEAVDALRPQRVSGALDDTAWPSVLPTQAESWIGEPRLVVRRGGMELFCRFVVSDIATEEIDVDDIAVDAAAVAAAGSEAGMGDGTTTGHAAGAGSGVRRDAQIAPSVTRVRRRVPVVTVTACDAEQGVGLTWRMELTTSGLVRQRASIRNFAPQPCAGSGVGSEAGGADTLFAPAAVAPLEVGKVELGFPLPAIADELLTTTGHHLHERSPQRQPLTVGRFEKTSLAGRPDFDASLLLTAGVRGFGFEHGEVFSVHVSWSGNSVLSAERLPYTQGVIGGGELLLGGEMILDEGQGYDTPWVYGAYGEGLDEVAARFHDHLRSLHPELVAKPRPVILNTWEAVYFRHDYDTLTALADKAVQSGVERFVVDDGWFGSRRDDTSGLGDWWIAQEVWPDGDKSLKALADYVHRKGMEFGLWFEPEMINPDSDTFRAHPDWVLKPTAGRLAMQGRSQQVIDLTNPDAYDHVYHAMDSLVGELGIDYIKWDHNKLVTEAVSPYSGRPAVHAQTMAVYRIFHDLKAGHPGLEIESCSSGGGRVDLGILALADRIWVSDCVDPVERADIQRYTSLLVPPFMMGEHVGASPAHSTQRATSQELRMAMAFFGHMGIEWNLLKEPQSAIDELGAWTAEFKRLRPWFATGSAVHGDDADAAVRLDGMVARDRSRAVYRFTQLTTSQTYPAAPVRLPGLDPERTYRVVPLPVCLDLEPTGTHGAAAPIGNGQSPLGWWNRAGVRQSGRALASYGLRPPSLHPAQAVLFEAVAE